MGSNVDSGLNLEERDRGPSDKCASEKVKICAEEIDIDDLLEPLGGFGKFQIVNIIYLCAFVLLSVFKCESSWGSEGKPWLSAAIPTADDGTYDSCLRFAYYQNWTSGFASSDTCTNNSFTNDSYKCDTFVFETEEWTVQREDWNIHCDGDNYWLSLLGSLNNVGQVIGSLYLGYLSDRFGRKAVIVILALTATVLGLIKSFSVSYAMMAILETSEGLFNVAVYNGAFVLALEIVDPSHRVLAGAILASAYALAEIILGAVQWLTLDWRITLRILYAPFFLSPLLWFAVPESVRWLMEKKRARDAVAVLEKMAKTNKRKLPSEVAKKLLASQGGSREDSRKKLDEKPQKSVVREMLRSKRMRYRVFATLLMWLLATFVYFGMTLSSVGVSGGKFLNFILNGVIEMIAYIVIYNLLDRAGRKICLSNSFFLCGVACILDAYVPAGDSNWSWAILVLYLIGKFAVSISFFVVDIFTTELFPTPVRATMMGIGLLVGKAASILAPEVPLLGDIYKPLPLLLFGGMATAAGFLTLTFPETLNTKLPDTVEEAENLGLKTPDEKQV